MNRPADPSVATASVRLGLLAYGADDARHTEGYAALLSVMAYAPAQLRCVVITDAPARYRWFEHSIAIESLSRDRLDTWKGPSADRYRPKIEAIRWLAATTDGHVVLIDTDTLARRPLDTLVARLQSGAFLLHHREYPIGAPPRRGDRRLKSEILGHTWNGITPTPQTSMWNGGVIGCSRGNAGVLDQVLDLFDSIRPASRHFALEQLSYSIVFEARGSIEEAAPWFDHYWANRPAYRRKIDQALLDMFMRQMTVLEAAETLRTHPIIAPLDGRPPKWKRTLHRIVTATTGPSDV